jgi:hypothetical protein
MLANCSNKIVDRSPDFATVMTIVALHKAEDRFHLKFGKYASLTELGPDGAHLIGRDLAGGTSYGHRITLHVTSAGYVIQGRPIHWGVDGRRSFYSDETKIIRQTWNNEEATLQSEVLK